MAEEVGHLPGREGADRSARLFNSVDQIGGEGMAEGMESPLFQAIRSHSPRHVADLLGHSTSEITEHYDVKQDTSRLAGITAGFDL